MYVDKVTGRLVTSAGGPVHREGAISGGPIVPTGEAMLGACVTPDGVQRQMHERRGCPVGLMAQLPGVRTGTAGSGSHRERPGATGADESARRQILRKRAVTRRDLRGFDIESTRFRDAFCAPRNNLARTDTRQLSRYPGPGNDQNSAATPGCGANASDH